MIKLSNKSKPKDTKKTIRKLLKYLGHHKWSLLIITILVGISSFAGIFGTYLLKPVINNYILPGNIPGLIHIIIFMAIMYFCGALACFIYNKIMVHVSQTVVSEIRMDLFRPVFLKWIC